MTQIDVLVLGGAGVDTIVRVPELPLPYADSYMVPAITTRAGQTGDGVALALAALGHRVHHLDVLGDDPEGDLVRALHTETGVPSPLSLNTAEPSERSIWSTRADGGYPCTTSPAATKTPSFRTTYWSIWCGEADTYT